MDEFMILSVSGSALHSCQSRFTAILKFMKASVNHPVITYL